MKLTDYIPILPVRIVPMGDYLKTTVNIHCTRASTMEFAHSSKSMDNVYGCDHKASFT